MHRVRFLKKEKVRGLKRIVHFQFMTNIGPVLAQEHLLRGSRNLQEDFIDIIYHILHKN